MTAVLILSAGLIAITALSYAGAERLRAPASVLLVLVGIAVSLIPHAPKVEIDPEVVLLLFLPPLIYASGVGMSWRGFRDNLQPILLLAIGCVLFTALAVAAAAHWLLGMPFAVALVMGAVVSPPDPVAPVALARRLKMPVRLLTVLEGEGLVNDATALILLSFGVQAVSAGGLSLTDAALRFILIVAGEIVWGLLAAFAALRLRARMNDPQSEITLALLTPFLAFWPPHMLGGSGVLAALAAGLYVSWHGPRFISPATRIQGFFVWGLVTHVLEGVLFLLIGLQARGLADALGRGDAHRLILAVALTGFVVVAARFIWIYPASALPRFIAARLGRKTPATEPGSAFLIAFTGIRGAVSLAGAFSIPALVHERAFPERELILFVTFCVIVLTLVGQGSLLPMVLRRLGLVALGEAEAREERRREVMARIKGVEAALERLDQAEQSGAPAPVVRLLRRRHEDRLQSYRRAAEKAAGHPVSDPSRLHVVLIEAERARLAELYAAKAFGDEARRRMERELDLQHALSRHSAESATGRSFDELL